MIFHIASAADWEKAQREGSYRPESLAGEGFIHCSTAGQALRVANAFFRGRTGLLLLAIDEGRLRPALRWEGPAPPKPGAMEHGAGEKFPHLYGPLNVDAVVSAAPLACAEDGSFVWPDGLEPA